MRTILFVLVSAVGLTAYAQAPDAPIELTASATGTDADAGPVAAVGNEQSYPHSLSAKVLMVDYGIAAPMESSVTNGIELAYLRRFTNAVTLALPVKAGMFNDPETIGNKRAFVSGDLALQIGHSFFGDRVRPYVTVGGGLTLEPMNGIQADAPLGGGIRVRLTDAAYVTGQYEYRKAFANGRDSKQVGIGLLFNLGKGKFDPRYWDTDGDGVMDHEDECVEIIGRRLMKGCPDTDGDGINDAADPCPEHFGTRKEGGCPDRDLDGVPDPMDECPGVPGVADRAGCPLPDKDGDGVGDDVDECPDLPGGINGCPDTDADGITDLADACPKQAGPQATGGCPDRDNDGVADKDDNCPLLPGELNGCPDRDNDGFDDAADRCPNIAGEHDGCPEIMRSQRQLFEFAVRAITFEPASARLTKEAYEKLTGLADILERYPEYQLRITGHADFTEVVPDRTAFSVERAKACAEFLTSRGVDLDRLVLDGIGAGRPITRKGTTQERAVNRRVEFDLFEPGE